jgi:hypothetical protein
MGISATLIADGETAEAVEPSQCALDHPAMGVKTRAFRYGDETPSCRYRCYPTPAQAAALARTVGCARFVYNWALRVRTDAYHDRQERLSYVDLSAALTTLKRQPETHGSMR